MLGVGFIGVLLVLIGASSLHQYLTTDRDPEQRFGSCPIGGTSALPSSKIDCVTTHQVSLVDASSADQVTVRYVSGSQDVVVNRSGGSPTSSFGGLDTIELESWHNGQNIALLDTTNDALMKLPGYPEPDPFSFTWQLGAGAPLLGIAIFLFFWRHALLQRMET